MNKLYIVAIITLYSVIKVQVPSKSRIDQSIYSFLSYTHTVTSLIADQISPGSVIYKNGNQTANRIQMHTSMNNDSCICKTDQPTENASKYGLTADGVTSDKTSLDKIFAKASNKRIIFPRNKKIYVGAGLNIIKIKNAYIDFNNCTLIENNASLASGGNYLLWIDSSSGVTIRNLKIDGKKSTIRDNSRKEMGIRLSNDSCVHFDNIYIHDLNYTGVWVARNTHSISFGKLLLRNIYGSKNVSGIYVSSDSLSDAHFINVTAENDTFVSGGRAVYNNGWNTTIDTLRSNNWFNAISYRSGQHYLGNVYCSNATTIFAAQREGSTNFNRNSEHPRVIVDHIFGYNIFGGRQYASAIYVDLADFVQINSADVTMSDTSAYHWYGVRITDPNNTGAVRNVYMKHIIVNGASVAAFDVSHTSYPVTFSNVTGDRNAEGFRSDSAFAPILITGYSFTNTPKMKSIIGSDTFSTK